MDASATLLCAIAATVGYGAIVYWRRLATAATQHRLLTRVRVEYSMLSVAYRLERDIGELLSSSLSELDWMRRNPRLLSAAEDLAQAIQREVDDRVDAARTAIKRLEAEASAIGHPGAFGEVLAKHARSCVGLRLIALPG